MSLQCDARVPERDFDVRFDVADGEVVALMGPNGAGKSTALSLIAGLLQPATGEIRLDGTKLDMPPHQRGIALMSQDALLFPHLSVLDNVAFGPRSGGESRRTSRDVARRWLDEVEAASYADRRPSQLSGGQAQRVALARALAVAPTLLLLDEPLAALDVSVAATMRQLLRRVLAGRTAVIVTHDVLDALLLADRVIVLDGGRVVEDGPTGAVLSRPRSAFAARVAGLNLVRGPWDGRAIDGIEGIPDSPLATGAEAVAVFRPSAVAVYRDPPGGSPRNVIPGVVTEIEPLGEQFQVRTDRLTASVTAAAIADLGLVPGSDVFFVVKASEVAIYPA